MDEKQRTVYRAFGAVLVTLILLCTGAAVLFPLGTIVNSVLCGIAFVSGFALLGLHRQMFAQMRQMERTCRSAEVQITRDGLTNTYDRDTSLRLIERFLQAEGKDGVHGLLMLEVGGLADIRAERGNEYIDMILMSGAEQVTKLFRKTDIIGRLREDAFVVFLKNVESRAQLEAQAATLLAELQSLVASGLQVPCCIGGAISPEDAAECAVLLQRAESALERAKGKGACNIAMYDPQTDDVFAV